MLVHLTKIKSMSNFRFKFLNNIDLSGLITLHNEVAKTGGKLDKLSIEELKTKIQTEGVELGLSIGAYVNKKLIGFILHGNNNGKLFNTLTCIDLEFKDIFLTSKMYGYALPLFRSFKLKQINTILHSTSDITIRNYRKIGFKKWRCVECINGNFQPSQIEEELKKIKIEPASYYEYLVLYAEKNTLPSFDNSEFVISNHDSNVIIHKALAEEAMIGYIIFNTVDNRILQIFVKESFRRMKIATLLVQSVLAKGDSFKITNIDSQYFPLVNFIKKIGAKKYFKVQKWKC